MLAQPLKIDNTNVTNSQIILCLISYIEIGDKDPSICTKMYQ